MHSSGDSLCDTSASWLEIAQICEDVLNVDLSLMDPSDLEQQRISVTPSTDLSLKASDYNEDPRKTFDSGESLFDSSDQFDQCITVLDDAVARLDVIEHTMDETIESLQNCYSSLIASGQVVCKLREEANSINIIESHIATFSEQLAYPTSLQSYIEESNPHSDEFKDALKTLSSKLSFVRLNANTYLNPCESARTHLDGLLQLALYRIKDRLSLSIQLLEDPASNFEILRDALLLNQKELLEFLRNHEPISFNEVVQQYIRLSTTKTRSSIEDYCRLFPSENLEEWPSHELLSLAQGLNKKFSDMLTVVWNRPSSATLGHANVAGKTTVQTQVMLQPKFFAG
ncbi:unnamed protein product [Chondrus crispus]|uniref:Vps52 coiled-coil domain-containing protein n=1 Tax=Chondrus crispus TaxID=2769 RepID=R7QGC8_CHOCR|nr:unnamed protein product [Chondrus crispus]CDF37577.1 unnamed protein product [Chondrus crispus]|eukprot:XP_005717448.1 unnamed protein product [Chondrus crispus]